MRYGHFDDENREYVIDRPDTPSPWVNYLGSPEYGAIISNNAGGYSFARSGANGRILRYIFNSFDQPGRYIYIRDNKSLDYWSASWQPVGKDLDDYKCQCRHGMGYTRMRADYGQISSEAAYEDTPDDASYRQETGHPAYRADDALWLFPTIYKYIAETGNTAFLDEVIPFADKESATVYEHLKRAVAFSCDHIGPHGMPAGLYADWNDCLRLGANGESSFVAFQFYYALRILKKFAEYRNDTDYLKYLEEKQTETGSVIRETCWDQDRFIRGYTETGERIGAADAPEADLWLNPQSWAVISGLASPRQADAILAKVYERLNTAYGALLMDPPYHAHAFDGALAVIYNQGTKENGGIFSQSQGWLILAEALCGHGGRAFTYFMENAPAAWNDQAGLRRLEPYCYGQFTEGTASRHAGRSHVHWLTGTASTMMVGCVEGILGLRPDLDGITISPSIPPHWRHLEIEKDFRGKHLKIFVENPDAKECGCKKLTVNGKVLDDNYIPASLLEEENVIRLIL